MHLIALTFALTFAAPWDPATLSALAPCQDSLDIAIFNTPRRPSATSPLHLLLTTTQPLPDDAALLALPPAATTAPALLTLPTTRFDGPPLGLVATLPSPAVGTWRIALATPTAVLACQDVLVRPTPTGPGRLHPDAGDPFWESRIRWERDTENLYSLWIQHLFDVPPGTEVSWNPLAAVLQDPARNLLYNHLGLDEDRDGLRLKPDCADFPYTLRAYFAWKMGLPMALRACRRGNAQRAPTCSDDLITNQLPTPEADRTAAFRAFARKLTATVHSSSLRTAPTAERSDLYPVALTRESLRPGTVYADPYGHTMMVLRWFPQSDGAPGQLLTVDAQPDGTIGLRLFWRGSFLFPKDGAVSGAGWKRFRPVIRRGEGLVALDNAAIAASRDYGDVSFAQDGMDQEAFYEAMDALINPIPMPPHVAQRALIDALHQQALRRVESIASAEAYFARPSAKPIPMPAGSQIFLTAGPWEDLSTPSRDMRLLIALDTVLGFADRVVQHPERFALDAPAGPTLQATLIQALQAELASRALTYHRSDGSPWTLTLADLVARMASLELAWNPNDCPELRWGAAPGSPESLTCNRHAPADQQAAMIPMRTWFSQRQRPLQH